MSAKLIQVIETDEVRGKGRDGDPCRRVTQYWSTDGQLLAERDGWLEQQRDSGDQHPMTDHE